MDYQDRAFLAGDCLGEKGVKGCLGITGVQAVKINMGLDGEFSLMKTASHVSRYSVSSPGYIFRGLTHFEPGASCHQGFQFLADLTVRILAGLCMAREGNRILFVMCFPG